MASAALIGIVGPQREAFEVLKDVFLQAPCSARASILILVGHEKLHPEVAKGLLELAVTDDSMLVRHNAVKMFVAMEGFGCQPLLRKIARNDSHPTVRAEAQYFLESLEQGHNPFEPFLPDPADM